MEITEAQYERIKVSIAIDGAGNAWIANNVLNGSVTEIANDGLILSGTTGYL